jgi:trk system potassium uptake protein TrkH
MDNFSGVPLPGKWIMIACMLLGRLEIYTIIVLLMPGFWRK